MLKESVLAIRRYFPWIWASLEKGPTEGNHRLTALTGSLLLPLLALIYLTGLFMDAWWHIHYAVGFVLIPVVVLKLTSTGYRALRYYTHHPVYRAAGPPEPLPRLIAPLLALSVLVALATGVALFLEHSRRGVLATLHTDSAVICVGLVGIHVLTYVPDALAAVRRELHARFSHASSLRVGVTIIALTLGIVLAALTYSAGVWPARPHDQRDGSGVYPMAPVAAGGPIS